MNCSAFDLVVYATEKRLRSATLKRPRLVGQLFSGTAERGVLGPAKWKKIDHGNVDAGNQAKSPDAKLENSGNYCDIHQSEGTSNLVYEKKIKVKLKIGGIAQNVQVEGDDGTSSAKPFHPQDASRNFPNVSTQDFADGCSLLERGSSQSKGDQIKVSSKASITYGKKENLRGLVLQGSFSGCRVDKSNVISSSELTRKSRRVTKRHRSDEEHDEIRFPEKLGACKNNAEYERLSDDCKNSVKKRNISKFPINGRNDCEVDEDHDFSRPNKGARKLRSGKIFVDINHSEEEKPGFDDKDDINRRKQTENSGLASDIKHLTTRQRARQSGQSSNGECSIELPNGLTPAPSRKQKEKISEVEMQAKKEEAAQKRKMQAEKKAREAEAEVIRKILGQNSDRKREEKEQKELAKKAKSAKLEEMRPNAIRWVNGPLGTTMFFGEDVDLPSIFNSKPCISPAPREKCAAPSCTNGYKYRDSKTNLPLCSLQCYRAVQVPGHSEDISIPLHS